ncbi:hypothetical protein TWF106_000769 [Orbilia oligospora]|uniref:Nitrite reductase [NAD(P)H] n=1 Tax=Orbilia oligospora TaxID=2813651 RepID=A0A7C8URP0_ORBOL|nr:hypothetical protein TWF679_004172 [Orbilia oligospora]KAF3226275.1 hypothetical protein TWF106_000769 [Orbilia oligospora]
MTLEIESSNGDIPVNGQNGANGNSNGDMDVNENGHSNGDAENGVNGTNGIPKKKIVIVGLGMVAVGFIEKLIKLDARRQEYTIVVIGEEPHVAYNRVGLTTFFEHRAIDKLYLNPVSWYDSHHPSLGYQINTKVESIHPAEKYVKTSSGETVTYDILILATGSDAVLPANTPGHDATGVFVYRNIADLEKMIQYSATVKGTLGCVVGGGLLGLEAAKALLDLENYGKVGLIDRNRWVLSRQLDSDAGGLVVEKVRELGVDVMLERRVKQIETNEEGKVRGVTFEDGDFVEASTVCFAIGIRSRDELARNAGLDCYEKSGGVVVNERLQTSNPDIYAIGECASWENQTFGLIAPGIEMADILAFNLTQAKAHTQRKFRRPDLSTKLKLLGVDVASFGDFFADRDGPRETPGRQAAAARRRASVQKNGNGASVIPPSVKALTYKDPFQGVYKKYLFTIDGKFLLGGMMIGDTKDYIKLVQMVKTKKQLEVPPAEFILGSQKSGEDNLDDIDDDTQICSCHNVTKGDVVTHTKNGTCKSIGDVKSCTKAGTGCGGCMPLVTSIFNATMKSMGAEISNHLCPHFAYSRADMYNIISVKKLKTFPDVMKEYGKAPDSVGCEACKPAIGSILASLYNRHVMDKDLHAVQDTNDRFLANIQRNGTFSVVPRVMGGEITADRLITIGMVAKKYGLYCKITGGQRIDMFGAKKGDLLNIWQELVDAGMESGHAYAKSLRTVKSCVGTTWCRFGIGDSVGMAVRLEERYKSIRAPHKIKGAVSGCVRECAEAQNKDFGLIATEKGFNVFIAGNGGAKPKHSELLAKDVPPDEVIPLIDRYLMFYIRTADKLQRTARWLENLPGGMKYLREVIIEDKLGICSELENQMQELVNSFFCEWKEAINNPEKRKMFQQFANTTDRQETMEVIQEREQERPTYWASDSVKYDFKGHKWSTLAWQPIIEAKHFEGDNSANVKRGETQLAVFKIKGKYYASQQMCPHKRSFVLSDGLIGDDASGKLWVSCPNHKRNFELNGIEAGKCANDDEINIAVFEAEEREDGWIYLRLPPVEELDGVLATGKWIVRKDEAKQPFEKMDGYLKGRTSKKPRDRTIMKTQEPVMVGGCGGPGLDW